MAEHARRVGVRLIDDLPIFVSADSVDVWSRPDLFLLDADRRPTVVAGVPPDYFSPTGQLWGNPHYDWEAHRPSELCLVDASGSPRGWRTSIWCESITSAASRRPGTWRPMPPPP